MMPLLINATGNAAFKSRPSRQPQLDLEPLTFGHQGWINRRGEETIDPERIARAALVAVERTPLFRVVGGPEPFDVDEETAVPEDVYMAHYEAGDLGADWERRNDLARCRIVDHDPAKYAPYTDLVCDGSPEWGYPDYYLLEIV